MDHNLSRLTDATPIIIHPYILHRNIILYIDKDTYIYCSIILYRSTQQHQQEEISTVITIITSRNHLNNMIRSAIHLARREVTAVANKRMISTTNVANYELNKIAVVGLGSMGHGVAQLCASAGYNVVAVDLSQEVVDHSMGAIEGSVLKLAQKKAAKAGTDGKAEEEEARAALSRIETSTDVNAVADCDLVIEAIVENLPIKLEFFENLGKITKDDCILASNTSSFPITKMAEASGVAHRVCGIHYFNPVQLMKLVEVVSTEHTEADVTSAMVQFAKQTGKVPVTCGDTPGFIVNRLLVPYIAQGVAMLARGDASADDIDTAMRLGAGYPMGPITLSDYVGNDINLAVMEGWMEAEPNNPAFQIPEG